MKKIIVPAALVFLITGPSLAQRTTPSPGPTNPVPAEATANEGTRSGSRGMTGNDGNDTIGKPSTSDGTRYGEHVGPDMKPIPSAPPK